MTPTSYTNTEMLQCLAILFLMLVLVVFPFGIFVYEAIAKVFAPKSKPPPKLRLVRGGKPDATVLKEEA